MGVVLRAWDSIPKLRRAVLEHLYAVDTPQRTNEVAEAVSHPSRTTLRALQDLDAHGVIRREVGGEGRADHWQIADWARRAYVRAMTVPTSSHIGTGDEPISITSSIPLITPHPQRTT